jgi:hypothetical protein
MERHRAVTEGSRQPRGSVTEQHRASDRTGATAVFRYVDALVKEEWRGESSPQGRTRQTPKPDRPGGAGQREFQHFFRVLASGFQDLEVRSI